MIVVNAVIEASEENIDAMREAIAIMEKKSQAESGCHDYTFSIEMNDPTKIRITEKWESMADLEAHFREPHMADFQQAMGAHPPKSVVANFFEVTEIPGPGQ
ncbi:MAG: antibiotic biosynthesis monooxygenase [Pseudomonadales bacterium]|nr:antibiotic biosynthesis monooxygenase [Pseudomonadales bacterium]